MSSPSGTSGSDQPPGDKARRKRPRRRRGGGSPRKSGSEADGPARPPEARGAKPGPAAGEPAAAGRDGPRTRGRRRGSKSRGKKKAPSGAAEVLARKPESVDLAKDVEEPLSPLEVAALRGHFRFLRAHRKELRLKVNAAEDLLLNGVREPTHRGVCQHLLGKVDRSSVLAAAERLEPAGAAKLLAGIIQFSADIEFVLLFLEKVKQSASNLQATAALAQGLERIDFDRVSSAQMRRVLGLIVELFKERDRPELLLGLLESRSFRKAFDASIEGLPEPLMRLLAPLRAVQAVVLHGRPNTYEPQILEAGIALLLSGDDASLRRRSAECRQRLFVTGLAACAPPDHTHHRSLGVLLASLAKSDQEHRESGLTLARHLIAAEKDDEARKVLKTLSSAHPDFELPSRWLARLDQPDRIGRFALEARQAERRDVLGQHRRLAGHRLDTMGPVWIQIGTPDHQDSHVAAAALLGELTLPGVVPLLASGVTQDDSPYFVTPNPGRALEHVLRHKGGRSLAEAVSLCAGGVTLLAAIADLGVRLPDGEPRRFEGASDGSLWLVDLAGGVRGSVDEAAASSLAAARSFCDAVLAEGRRYLAPSDLLDAVREARSSAELARWLARSSLVGARA